MSEKHLTEPPWKLLVANQGLKDLGLQKALAAYTKLDATKEPDKALEALRLIAELAAKVKKAYLPKQDVVDHLDEVLKEAKKSTPALEARIKSADTATLARLAAAKKAADAEAADAEAEHDAEEEKSAAEFKKDLKNQMMSALAQVRSRAPGDPEQQKEPKPQFKFMAYLAGKNSAVVVARKVGTATRKLLPEIAGGASGGKFPTGECIFENSAHTFVLEKVPSGLARKLAKALHAETGVKYKVRVRSTDGSVILDSDTDVDTDDTASFRAEAPAPSPAPPAAATAAAPPASGEGMTKFTTRFKALQPDIVSAIAAKGPQSDEIKKRATEAGALAGKKDFEQAHRLLDGVETLLRTPPAAPATTAAAPPTTDTTTRRSRDIKLSTYLTGRANLRIARENAAKELQRLQQAICAKAADEPFYKEVEAKSQRLLEYLAPIDDAVANKLDEAGRCTDPELQVELNNKVRELIQKQLTSLRGHALASFVEKNPFGKFIIKQPLEVTLSALDKQLS